MMITDRNFWVTLTIPVAYRNSIARNTAMVAVNARKTIPS